MQYDIGILGGGQLARMSAIAAREMGLSCLCLDPSNDCPAAHVASIMIGSLEDPSAIRSVFEQCAFVTYENEFIESKAVALALKESRRDESCLTPGLKPLATIQDKLLQRKAYASFGAPSPGLLDTSGRHLEFPFVAKARFGGYDGKGVRIVRDRAEADQIQELINLGQWYAEEFVPFKRELAVMVCRSQSQTVCFPTMETVQTDNVCDLVFPSGADASAAAIQAVEAVEGYGLFGVELFELEGGSFQVNEVAPRPHNTGHYTIDWGGLTQFEAHVRLVSGMTLPKPQGQPSAMANLLGQPDARDFRAGLRAAYKAVPDCHVHWYGKSESRPGRKMGHINAVGSNAKQNVQSAREAFYAGWTS